MKDEVLKFFKIFGLIYFLLNCIVSAAMVIFAIRAYMATNMSPGYMVFILPLIGIFAGYWMHKGKYGWWRIIIITVNLLITVVILFTVIFIAPGIEKHKQNKFDPIKKLEILEHETNKLF